jgi:hypothetical protein
MPMAWRIAEVGFYRAVRVKGWASMLIRTLVAARRQQMANQIRGLMKTFGLVVPKGMGRIFDHHVRSLLASHAGLERIILRAQTAKLSRQVVVMSTQCRLLTCGGHYGHRLRCGDRGSGHIHHVALCGRLGWPDTEALSVRRSGL